MRAVLFAVIAGLCWGVGEIFTKAALNSRQVGPMAVLLVRALVTVPPALLAYLGAAYVTRSETASWWREMDGGVWARLVLGSGLMAGFAGVFFFYWGLASPGGDISRIRPIAFSLAPASAVVLGWLMLGEAMTMRKAAAVALILIGIVMLTGTPHAAGEVPEGGMPAGK
jgi:uncharacterized membrane protein